MTRALARVKHDEVVRMVKAVQRCGLAVSGIEFNGQTIRVLVDSGEHSTPALDADPQPENFESLDEYRAWRERERAREG